MVSITLFKAPVLLHSLLFLLAFLSIPTLSLAARPIHELRTYIVHVHRPPTEHTGTHRDWHHSFLRHGNVDGSRLLYSYSHVLSGFAARLTEEEVNAMRSKEGFLHAQPSHVSFLKTTHTPSFLGLHRVAGGLWRSAGYGKGIIIGVVDTGIVPDHPSFNDAGMPPPPSRWKGRCDSPHFCNNKIIGSRSFNLSQEKDEHIKFLSTYDFNGHGTHVAGTVAGRFVSNSSVLGSARGTAVGVAPEAYLAIYEVCHPDGSCSFADVVAAMEQAVDDGVDIISLSIGAEKPAPLYEDLLAISSFGAMTRGVFVAAAAGNEGPKRSTVGQAAPWMLSVGASTMDRRIRAVVKLGDGSVLEGESAYQPKKEVFPSSTLLPLAYPMFSSFCLSSRMLKMMGVKGKVVVCQYGIEDKDKLAANVKGAGGVGMILTSPSVLGFQTESAAYMIPTSQVSYEDGLAIEGYVKSTSVPKASISFMGTEIGGDDAPAVAAFSSKGPSLYTPGVLKPDIIGPGVNILAAWPHTVGPFEVKPAFNILSGTSMSCPHLSGVVALMKELHPEWSPAKIRSAIMTTADVRNVGGKPILDLHQKRAATFHEMGAGHVNPSRAANPGLVYDIDPNDYIRYLCSISYTDEQASIVSGSRIRCSEYETPDGIDLLNYPSIAVQLTPSANSTRLARKTVTNVGRPNSTYTLSIVRPIGITVDVDRRRMSFSGMGQKVEYTVRFRVNRTEESSTTLPLYSEGYLIWTSSDRAFTVRSPISVAVGYPRNSAATSSPRPWTFFEMLLFIQLIVYLLFATH